MKEGDLPTQAININQSSHPTFLTILALTHILMKTTIVAIAPNTHCVTMISALRLRSPSGGGLSFGGGGGGGAMFVVYSVVGEFTT